MIASLLLLTVGAVDLTRPLRVPAARIVVAVLVLVVLGCAGTLGLSLAPVVVVPVLLIALGWLIVMPWDAASRGRRGLWPVAVLAAAVLAALVLEVGMPAVVGPLADAYDSAIASAAGVLTPFARISFDLLFAGAAVVLFLTQSANVIVRAALGPVLEDPPAAAPASAGSRWRRRRRVETADTDAAAAPPRPQLRGGRLIGPLERILIVVLAFAGMQAVIAAVVAAKGIVRFPEISSDQGQGSKAEQFLVGTLTSCALAAAGALYLYATASA